MILIKAQTSKFPEKAAKITIQGHFTLGNKYLQAGYVVITHSFRNSLLRLNQIQIIYTQNQVDRMILILAKFCRSQGSLPFVLRRRDGRVTLGTRKMRVCHRWNGLGMLIERFSYDLEMETREKNRKNKRTEIERFDWFIERIQTFKWKTSCPRTF